ncbi:MAG: SDR family oxidoreductase [Phycisphaerales bacterium]|nr:SDR family oxidoreductase [Phycisphaerales bacterium]
MDTTLTGKRAVVCGSTQGIGRATAEALAALGASVTLVARHPEALAQVQAGLAAAPGQAHASVRADFSDLDGLAAAVSAHLDDVGAAHILVNNSGGPPAGPAISAKTDEFTAGFTQHLLASHTLVQMLAPGMRAAGYGRIINIISTSVIMPIKGLGVSNTIRGAVANWARTLAAELGPHGITVNNVLPGFTATARLGSLIQGRASRAGCSTQEIEAQMKQAVPAGRFGRPEEIAEVVAFLASPAASYVNGVHLPVDGGRLAAS